MSSFARQRASRWEEERADPDRRSEIHDTIDEILGLHAPADLMPTLVLVGVALTRDLEDTLVEYLETPRDRAREAVTARLIAMHEGRLIMNPRGDSAPDDS